MLVNVLRDGSNKIYAEFANPQEYVTESIDDSDADVVNFRAEQARAMPSEEVIHAELGMGVADALNQAQIIGGNTLQDSYDTTLYTDLVNSVNLDTSTPGKRLPTRQAATSIALSSGWLTGNMTAGGGLAVLVDGNTAQGFTACARNSTAQGWFVISFPTARRISQVTIYPSDNRGFQDAAGTSTISISISAKNGALPIGPTDDSMFLLGTTGNFTDATTARTIVSSDQYTTWQHLMVVINSSAAGVNAAEVQVTEPGLYNAMTLYSTSLTADVPPDVIGVVLTANYDVTDNVQLNTDLILSVSRDGTTWATGTLSMLYDINVPRKVVLTTGRIDVSGQPALTSVKYKLQTVERVRPIEITDMHASWGIR